MTNETMYIRNKISVLNYRLLFDEKGLLNIKEKINEFYGKGNTHITITDYLSNQYNEDYPGYTLEIVSKEKFDDHLYEYTFYAFKQHKLANIIDDIVNYESPIRLSFAINSLINFTPSNGTETNFYKEILNSFDYNPQKMDRLVNIDVTNRNFAYKINKLKEILMLNHKDLDESIISFDNFGNDLNEELNRSKEIFLIETNEEEINEMKRLIKKLPTIDEMKKKIN